MRSPCNDWVAYPSQRRWLNPRDFAPDELRNNNRNWPQTIQKAASEAPTVRANPSETAVQGGHPMMNAVGGTSMHYWAQSWRLNPWDFKVVSSTLSRYGRGRIPEDSTVEDWPISYEDLEPFYDKVEYAVGVSGRAGNVQGVMNSAGNIFEGQRRREYPMQPLRSSPFTDLMSSAAVKMKWHPFQGPAAITTEVYDGRPPCQYHGFCNKGGCHVQAKSSTAFSSIPKAIDTGNLDLVTFARVTEITTDVSGKVTGVEYVKGNEVFLSELIWREFFMQILYNFPHVVNNSFKSKYDKIEWRNNKEEFKKWCEGKTGYPIVDAGMRQLNQTGYMHNRVRMIVAGFLCKHLLIDWRWGEKYFAKKLLDYELSSNNGNWQWAAGTGCDAAPYFRIFNPFTQQKKFDKEFKYAPTTLGCILLSKFMTVLSA